MSSNLICVELPSGEERNYRIIDRDGDKVKRVQYLDKGVVELLAVGPTDNPERFIAEFARGSFGDGAYDDDEKNASLINYLVEHEHTSPLESARIWLKIKAPIFVLRQFTRHRTACLTAETNLDFVRPCDGRRYSKSVGDIYKTWTNTSKENFGYKETKERLKCMKLRSFNEDSNEVYYTSIKDIWSTGFNKIFKIKLEDGRTSRMTENHRVLTSNGWKMLKEVSTETDLFVTVAPRGVEKNNQEPEIDESSEEWMKIEGYEDYEISNMGRVRTKKRKGVGYNDFFSYKKGTVNNKGLVVSLSKNSKSRAFTIHRLVLNAFSGLKADGQECRHLNGNFLDNRLENLVWGSAKENREDGKRLGETSLLRKKDCKIISILEDGFEETFDIEVEGPYHNFLINNGMVVHNCLNELSLRYSEHDGDFYLPSAERFCGGDKWNKQGSGEQLPLHAQLTSQDIMRRSLTGQYKDYQEMLSLGVSRETARQILGTSFYSTLCWTMDTKNLMHLMKLRMDGHAQQEIVDLANIIYYYFKTYFPALCNAFEKHIALSKKMSPAELALLSDIVSDYVDSMSLMQTSEGPNENLTEFALKKAADRLLEQHTEGEDPRFDRLMRKDLTLISQGKRKLKALIDKIFV